MEKEYLSTRKAADMLGVAVSTIQLWTDNGLLQGWTTNGGHRRISLDSINNVLQKRNLPDNLSNQTGLENSLFSIVIVEDDSSQINLYKQQFNARDLNINLVIAKNGYEGLIQIGKCKPSIIITDLLMPDMDGFQMLKTLANISELKQCLIIVISALSRDEVENLGGIPEGVLFYSKPIPFDDLENVILKKMIKM